MAPFVFPTTQYRLQKVNAFSYGYGIALLVLAISFKCVDAEPHWQPTGKAFPASATQVRSFAVRENVLYAGIGGHEPGDAQVWHFLDGRWSKVIQADAMKVAAMETDTEGKLYLGVGSPHSAERSDAGKAEVRIYDARNQLVEKKRFPTKDVIYSMAWYLGKLHVGTMAEDIPGSAEIWRFDDPGWTKIAGAGICNWPSDNTYAAIYEMHVHHGELYAGTFSRTLGDGDILRLSDEGWEDVNAPPSLIALALASYEGKLVATMSKFRTDFKNPVFCLQDDGTWKPLGVAPREWEGAYIPNHMAVLAGHLYLGLGGERGTLSVWRLDGNQWIKTAGDGRFNSWTAPLSSLGSAEWVYRMKVLNDKLYAGLASDGSPIAEVWQMSLTE